VRLYDRVDTDLESSTAESVALVLSDVTLVVES
jgi:hypothetical protein